MSSNLERRPGRARRTKEDGDGEPSSCLYNGIIIQKALVDDPEAHRSSPKPYTERKTDIV
jgi:hypothetical protein